MTGGKLFAELYRQLAVIADDEASMAKVVEYVKALATEKQEAKAIGSSDKESFDAVLASFSGDWGGNGDARDIARELRQGPEMVRDVPTW